MLYVDRWALRSFAQTLTVHLVLAKLVSKEEARGSGIRKRRHLGGFC